MMWIWFALAIVCIVVEFATVELVAIWFGASALVMGIIASIFPELHVIWQIAIFTVLSTALLLCTRTFVKKLMNRKKDQETNLELVINHTAMVVEDIDNLREVGAIKINGIVWTARSENGELIAKDTIVTVKEIKGNKAIVKSE